MTRSFFCLKHKSIMVTPVSLLSLFCLLILHIFATPQQFYAVTSEVTPYPITSPQPSLITNITHSSGTYIASNTPECRCALPSHCADGSGLIKPRLEENKTTTASPAIPMRYFSASPTCQEGLLYCCHIVIPPTTAPPPPPPPPPCGVQKTTHVPGFNPPHPQLAAYGEFPWLVRIVDASYNHIASGVLVSPDKVVTVAHLFDDKAPAFVFLGEWNSAVTVVPHKPMVVRVSTFVPHPNFNPVNLRNDIAVIKLESPYNEFRSSSSPQIGSVCLGPEYFHKNCFLSTFGEVSGDKTPIIHKMRLPIVGGTQCEDTLRERSILGRSFILNKESFMCAGGPGHGDACIGHGGAPLVCEGASQGQFYLAGLVSWGLTDTCPPPPESYVLPGVYTNIQSYLHWIRATP